MTHGNAGGVAPLVKTIKRDERHLALLPDKQLFAFDCKAVFTQRMGIALFKYSELCSHTDPTMRLQPSPKYLCSFRG